MIAFFDNRKPTTIAAFTMLFIVLKLFVFFGASLLEGRKYFLEAQPYNLLISSSIASFVLGSIIIFIIAFAINISLNSSNLFSNKRNYIGAALFVLLTSIEYPLHVFGSYSSILVALAVVYFILLNSSKVNRPSDSFFYLGILSGLLFLLDHELLIYLPFIILAANAITVVSIKDFFKWIGGLISPFIWYFGLVYLISPEVSPFQKFYFDFSFIQFNPIFRVNVAFFTLLFYSLFLLFVTTSNISKLSFGHRKLVGMNIFLLVGAYIFLLINGSVNTTSFILLLFPSVALGSFNVLTMSKKWNIDIIHFIFVVLIVLNNYVFP